MCQHTGHPACRCHACGEDRMLVKPPSVWAPGSACQVQHNKVEDIVLQDWKWSPIMPLGSRWHPSHRLLPVPWPPSSAFTWDTCSPGAVTGWSRTQGFRQLGCTSREHIQGCRLMGRRVPVYSVPLPLDGSILVRICPELGLSVPSAQAELCPLWRLSPIVELTALFAAWLEAW